MTNLTRRQVLARGGALAGGTLSLGVAGLIGFDLPHGTALTSARQNGTPVTAGQEAYSTAGLVHRYVTRPDLTPPAIEVTSVTPAGLTGTPYVFLSVKGYPNSSSGPGQAGNLIVDRNGRVVWFRPSGSTAYLGLTTQTYRGKPVLTWWQGDVADGHGSGEGIIADSSYQTIATVRAGNGLMADLHEFVITPQDTALLTAYQTVPADLSSLGGRSDGYLLAGLAQEVDIATGKVLFQWDSLDHVPLAETMIRLRGGSKRNPFDYFHINSLALAPDGDLLISARNTCAVYKVSRQTGAVAWRLGGKQSSFTMKPGARFYCQHDVRPLGTSTLSIFDDGGAPPRFEKESRAILLHLDTTTMTAALTRSYEHPTAVSAVNQGSMEVLPDGRVFVGWGNAPYFSEFSADGTIILDGEFPAGVDSYRAFTAAWTGTPGGKPDVAAHINPAGGSIVYVSWNGATQVADWEVQAGPSPDALTSAGRQEWSGFETPIAISSRGPYFAVIARDAAGAPLAQSATVRVQSA